MNSGFSFNIGFGNQSSDDCHSHHHHENSGFEHNQMGFPNFLENSNLVEYKSDIFYPNGAKKYESFFKRFFHPDGTKVYDDFHKDFIYSNGQKAYDGFHNHVFYMNGKKAFDGFFKVGNYDNGNKAGSEGINFSSNGVSMRLNGGKNEFWISLGNNFFVLIQMNNNTLSFKLFSDGNLVFKK